MSDSSDSDPAKLRIAILGGGTAGAMAAMHLTRGVERQEPLELLQFRDPKTPTIGVGESTTSGVHAWLRETLPERIDELEERCGATPKRGVRFEGWGSGAPSFDHDFVPLGNHGLHLCARELVRVLDESIRARQIHARVHALEPLPEGGCLLHTEDRVWRVDLVVDARGYPAHLEGSQHLALPWIPTNTALVCRGPAHEHLGHTRAVARPHGWIFVIPLRGETAYGYVTRSEESVAAEADFAGWLGLEGVGCEAAPRRIAFPNFVRRRVVEGPVFAIGNAASFIEPLEATALAVVKNQLSALEAWIQVKRRAGGTAMAERLAAATNRELVEAVVEVSLFVGFHYAQGSIHDTSFWRDAREGFRRALEGSVSEETRARFHAHLELGSSLSLERVRRLGSKHDVERMLDGRAPARAFGGISALGFAQVAAGIGHRS